MGDTRLLFDYGSDPYGGLPVWSPDVDMIDAVFVTHAHHDHIAGLLYLYVEDKYDGPWYGTNKTGELARLALADCIKLKSKSLGDRSPFQEADVDRQFIRKWLNKGASTMLGPDAHLLTYVLASDTGFAPNVDHGYFTLACCKPGIRSTARIGDWVMGTMPARHGRNRLGYIMRVDEAMTFDDYYRDRRFVLKRPSGSQFGDNIYFRKEGKFIQVENRRHRPEQLKDDTKADRVLISSLFWYFGKKAPAIPRRLVKQLTKEGRSHKRIRQSGLVKKAVSWISRKYRPGVHGTPQDM